MIRLVTDEGKERSLNIDFIMATKALPKRPDLKVITLSDTRYPAF